MWGQPFGAAAALLGGVFVGADGNAFGRRPEGRRVAVGMPVARHPPHRSVLALLTHTVPTLDIAPSAQWASCLASFAAFDAHGPARLARYSGSVSGTS